jgi:hypothetical protein
MGLKEKIGGRAEGKILSVQRRKFLVYKLNQAKIK